MKLQEQIKTITDSETGQLTSLYNQETGENINEVLSDALPETWVYLLERDYPNEPKETETEIIHLMVQYPHYLTVRN